MSTRTALLLVLTTLLPGSLQAQGLIDFTGGVFKLDSSLHAEGDIQAGSTTKTGDIFNYNSGFTFGLAGKMSSNSDGGLLNIFDELGNRTAFMQADVVGTGGTFGVFSRPTEFPFGFFVVGNNGTGSPIVMIFGTSTSTFDMSLTGDASVVLPTDAVNATEILNETGVTQSVDGIGHNLAGTEVVESTTITAPTAGFVLVIGSGVLDTDHINGTDSEAHLGVSDDCDGTPTLPGDQDNQLEIPGAAPTGAWAFPVSAQKIFPVSAGANTFCIVTSAVTGSWETWDESLSAIFIPTSYGSVDQARPGGEGDKGALTASDIAAEQARAAAANQARIDRELAEMRARVAELERYLEQVMQEQGQADSSGGGR